jgi:hypothetical protein
MQQQQAADSRLSLWVERGASGYSNLVKPVMSMASPDLPAGDTAAGSSDESVSPMAMMTDMPRYEASQPVRLLRGHLTRDRIATCQTLLNVTDPSHAHHPYLGPLIRRLQAETSKLGWSTHDSRAEKVVEHWDTATRLQEMIERNEQLSQEGEVPGTWKRVWSGLGVASTNAGGGSEETWDELSSLLDEAQGVIEVITRDRVVQIGRSMLDKSLEGIQAILDDHQGHPQDPRTQITDQANEVERLVTEQGTSDVGPQTRLVHLLSSLAERNPGVHVPCIGLEDELGLAMKAYTADPTRFTQLKAVVSTIQCLRKQEMSGGTGPSGCLGTGGILLFALANACQRARPSCGRLQCRWIG